MIKINTKKELFKFCIRNNIMIHGDISNWTFSRIEPYAWEQWTKEELERDFGLKINIE